jgi:gliding motility-associated-like protein
LVADVTGTNVVCFGTSTGTLVVVPSGGTTPYEYLWNNFVTDSTQSGVTAGRYVVLVTDSNGCHTYDSILITEPSEIIITGVVTDVVCSGFNTGAIDITVIGGTGAYTFAWSDGSTTEDIDTLAGGSYTVTVADANGCVKTATFVINEIVTLYTTVSVSDPTCFGGSNGFISVVVTGGTIPYTYNWSTTPPLQGATATNLDEGTYTLTVSDANNCSATVSAILINPVPIVVTTTPTPARCYNTATGIVTANVTGGAPPYVYQLNGIIQPSNIFSNLLPGNYIIAVRDANGCEGTATFTITAPIPVTVELTAPQDVILQGMTTQLIATASSNVAIINYFWSPLTDTAGNSLFTFTGCPDPDNCSNPYVTPPFTTVFTVSVMNADSCFAYDTVTVTVEVQPSAFIPSAFTPNGDGMNDRFDFDILGATTAEVSIFNRWGERVFFTPNQKNGTNTGEGWDGKKDGDALPVDTYVYQMKVTYAEGLNPQGLVKDRAGTITIMR